MQHSRPNFLQLCRPNCHFLIKAFRCPGHWIRCSCLFYLRIWFDEVGLSVQSELGLGFYFVALSFFCFSFLLNLDYRQRCECLHFVFCFCFVNHFNLTCSFADIQYTHPFLWIVIANVRELTKHTVSWPYSSFSFHLSQASWC